MADRDVLKKTYLTESEAIKLSRWADEVNKSESALLREAILEYLDMDRTARIEEKVDTLLTHLDADDAHTHKPENGVYYGTDSLEKAFTIVNRLNENHGEVMQSSAVDRAIEDIAGIDDRTKEKYKQLFKQRGILYQHPGERQQWTNNSDLWLKWMKDYARVNGQAETEKVADPYPASVTMGVDEKVYIELQDGQVEQ